MAVREKLSALVSRIPSLSRPKAATKAAAKAATKLATKAGTKASSTFVTAPLESATKATKAAKPARALKATTAAKAGTPVGKRERIDTTPSKPGGSRYVRRDADGHFTKDQVSVGKSLAADRRTKAKTKATKGNKDRGD